MPLCSESKDNSGVSTLKPAELALPTVSEVPCASCVRHTCCFPADVLLACTACSSWRQIGFGGAKVCIEDVAETPLCDEKMMQQHKLSVD